jgi:hypothetical protein
MTSSVDGVEHHVRVVSTIRVFAAGDIGRHRRGFEFLPPSHDFFSPAFLTLSGTREE